MRLEISFQVQKKFPSQLKSYNGGITLAWAIRVTDKDKFDFGKKPPNLAVRDVCQADRLAMRRPHQLDSDSPQQKLDRLSSSSQWATDSVWTTTSHHPHVSLDCHQLGSQISI